MSESMVVEPAEKRGRKCSETSLRALLEGLEVGATIRIDLNEHRQSNGKFYKRSSIWTAMGIHQKKSDRKYMGRFDKITNVVSIARLQ